MKDKFYRYTTTGGRKVINKIERVHPSDWKYILFYRYTNYLLKKDFQRADTYNFRNNFLSKKIPFKFWIMWWQRINKDTSRIIINNIKN
mgnify:CR=1 FL=1|jgi:hypothetical protein